MVFLSGLQDAQVQGEDVRGYLESTPLLPSLELAMEEMIKAYSEPGSNIDPMQFLASWLLRYNPRYNNGDTADAARSARSRAALAGVPYIEPPASAGPSRTTLPLKYPVLAVNGAEASSSLILSIATEQEP